MLGYVLSGGGARGAYEAGVLRFVLQELPRRTGVDPTPRVVSGTSIGALTGAWIAAMGAQGASRISRIWQEMVPGHVYRFSGRDLVGTPELLLRRSADDTPRDALFDPAPVRALIRDSLPWGELHNAIDSGRLAAFVVAATDVASGMSVAFVDGVVQPHCTPHACIIPTRIRAEHCLASAAIPIVFPSVEVDGRWYVDGALRQNTPLSPAIACGVDRVLVVGVKRTRQGPGAVPTAYSPTPAFLAGKALNALMLDPIEEDLRRLQELNDVLAFGEHVHPGFLDLLAEHVRPYRVVRALHVKPTEDLGAMAATCFRACKESLPLATRVLLHGIARNEPADEADLMSYLLFHHAYTGELEALGYADAARMEEELAALFVA